MNEPTFRPKEEKEIKIKLDDAEYPSLIETVRSVAKGRELIEQKDIYFDTPNFAINNLNRGLRVRFEGSSPVLLEFKSLFYNENARVENPWFIEEIAVRIPVSREGYNTLNGVLGRLNFQPFKKVEVFPVNYNDIENLLHSIGLVPSIIVSKKRQVFEGQNATFMFDEIEGLGIFLEIEAKGKNDPLDIFKSLFGEKPVEIVRNGYNDMIAAGLNGCLSNNEKQTRFKQDPKWNVLETEMELVESLLRG